ncbi:MAG: nucleotidyltransferase [Syntrophomonadaceae bacterium]|nr:nucleotidyltransferase [Syntrophomonadaceae bacterium]
MLVANHFQALVQNLQIEPATEAIIASWFSQITARLNQDFWGINSPVQNSRYVGSYGRGTAIKGIRDIDIAFELPPALFAEFDRLSDNGPGKLLETVRQSLAQVAPKAKIGQDERTIVINTPEFELEVIPVFQQADQSYLYPHASYGGRWRPARLLAEIEAIEENDQKHHGKVRKLAKMMAAWRREHQVPLSGLLMETLIIDFLDRKLLENENYSEAFAAYPYLTRDFLAFLAGQDINQKHWLARGSEQFVYRLGTFENHARASLAEAQQAIVWAEQNQEAEAVRNWQKIFGTCFSI